MYSIRSQNPLPQSSLQSKRQSFRNQIRKQKMHEYRSKIRHKLIFDNEIDEDVLKNVNLTDVMHLILQYEFPRNTPIQSEDISIDDCTVIYDIENSENAAIFKAIEGLFLYATSSNQGHVTNLMQEKHIFRLAEILERKVIEMKPLFKEKSYTEGKTANDLRLPPIYERILVILTQCSYDETLFFEESIKYIIQVMNQVLRVFPRQTRIVQGCVYSVASSMHNRNLVSHLLFLLSDVQEKECLLTRIMDIFAYEVKHFESSSQHSIKLLTGLLYFYEKAFLELTLNDLYPNMRRDIYKQFANIFNKKNMPEELMFFLTKTLKNMYNPDFGNVSQIVLESEDVVFGLVNYLQYIITAFKDKNIKENTGQKVQIVINCLTTLRTIFQEPDPDDQHFEQITQFLAQEFDQTIDLMLQDTLKIAEKPIIFHTLQLIKTICNWGDFIEKILSNGNIIIKLFYFCSNESINIKKQAICSLCNIIEGYFDGKAYHDSELCEIYDHLVEKFDFLDIIVENLDKHSDIDMNVEILKIVKILCYFWQSDPQLGKYNRFWTKFVQNGGELKLNTIITEERNEKMKELAMEILDEFVMTQEYQIEI